MLVFFHAVMELAMMKFYLSVRMICFSLLAFTSSEIFADISKTKTTISDSVITTKIESKIILDPSISVYKVNVSTNKDGIVTLGGTVNSDTDAAALIQIAQSTDGVNDVDVSNLMVKNSKQPFADTVITAKVKGIFIRENLLGRADAPVGSSNVSIETNNAVVYLSGDVNTQKEANNAVNLAKTIKGVKNVESRIKVVK